MRSYEDEYLKQRTSQKASTVKNARAGNGNGMHTFLHNTLYFCIPLSLNINNSSSDDERLHDESHELDMLLPLLSELQQKSF